MDDQPEEIKPKIFPLPQLPPPGLDPAILADLEIARRLIIEAMCIPSWLWNWDVYKPHQYDPPTEDNLSG